MASKSKAGKAKGASGIIGKTITLRSIMIVLLFVAIIAGLSVYLSSLPAPGGEWTSFTLNYNNSRYQAESSINSSNIGSLAQQWYINTRYSVTSTPIVLNGIVYFADWGGNVYAASITNGNVIWKTNLNQYMTPNPASNNVTAISSTLAISNGRLYVADGDGSKAVGQTYLFALNLANGAVIWKDGNSTFKTTESSMWGSPTVYNNLVYIGVAGGGLGPGQDNAPSKKGEIYALNAQSGALVWNYVTSVGTTGGCGVWSTPVVDPKLNAIYFGVGSSSSYNGTNDRWCYSTMSLNATTGRSNWIYQVFNNAFTGNDFDFGSTPNLFTIKQNNANYSAVGVGNKAGNYYTFNRVNGTVLDEYKIGLGGNGVIGVAGFIYLSPNNPEVFIPSYYEANASISGAVTAYLPASNTVAWRFYTPGYVISAVNIVPGAIIFGDEKGNVYAVNTTTGKQLLHTSFPNTQINAGVTVAEGYALVPTSFSAPNLLGVYGYKP